MAKFVFYGLEKFEKQLMEISDPKVIEKTVGAGLYKGAGIIADEIREEIEALPLVGYNQIGTPEKKLNGISPAQKEGLLDGFGISPMALEDGFFNVKLGFHDYNAVRQPNAIIARSVNSGTSFREKIPFVDRAVSRTREKAIQVMKEEIERQFEKLAKET